ncbi:hypothetical protein MBAV_000737 [Candidatus Magnetobacterium bavaricum]|uniref:Uncharacterized protein n=1 Tax=Candidatus Magnetobacterium bavaricum TaxID=29290 RepID=A0A0F3GYW1_9BACT|nr:hypothetical protein MBAV_000737 [Candidatus Magnetobacterium bavaricum]
MFTNAGSIEIKSSRVSRFLSISSSDSRSRCMRFFLSNAIELPSCLSMIFSTISIIIKANFPSSRFESTQRPIATLPKSKLRKNNDTRINTSPYWWRNDLC